MAKMDVLQIRMLGGFSAEVRGKRIDDQENRSQKPWLLMAYLIANRERAVTQEELLGLCWEGEEKDDPANALRVVLHRTRALLDKLEIGSGMDMIQRSRDGFSWNCRLPVAVDAEEFERLHDTGKLVRDENTRLECFRKAIALYRGPFLGRNSGGGWVRRMAEKQRERYVDMVLASLDILSDSGREEEAVELARETLSLEPYREAVCRHLMEDLMKLNRAEQVLELYEQLRAALLAAFDRSPEEETQRVYFRAVRMCAAPKIPVELHTIGSDKNGEDTGAKVCDFSFFQMFYVSAEFLIRQCGLEIYNILFTIEGGREKMLSRRSMERAADALTQQLKQELRRGNVVTQCAENQLLAMTSANGYDEACLCCERQVKKFYQAHPNTPVKLGYGVWRVGGESIEQ